MSDQRPRSTPPVPARSPAPPTVVQALAATTAVLGVAMIATALYGGGGLGSYGVLVGLLFVAAGVLRLKLIRGQARADAVAAEPPADPDQEGER